MVELSAASACTSFDSPIDSYTNNSLGEIEKAANMTVKVPYDWAGFTTAACLVSQGCYQPRVTS